MPRGVDAVATAAGSPTLTARLPSALASCRRAPRGPHDPAASLRLTPDARAPTARQPCRCRLPHAGSGRRRQAGFTARRHSQALVDPPGHAARHGLHRKSEFGDAQRATIGAVAVRAGAVGDENGPRRPGGEPLGGDVAVRQADRARHVPCRIGGTATHIEHDEAWRLPARGGVTHGSEDIGAIGLEREAAGDVRPCAPSPARMATLPPGR